MLFLRYVIFHLSLDGFSVQVADSFEIRHLLIFLLILKRDNCLHGCYRDLKLLIIGLSGSEFLKIYARKAQELHHLVVGASRPFEKLVAVHTGIMKLMLEHFNYAQAITKYIIMNRDLMTGLDSFELVKACFSGKKSDEECRLITFQLTSLHELSVLRHEELRKYCGTDLRDDAQLSAFVRRNIGKFLEIQEDVL